MNEKLKILDDSSDSEVELNINKDYAKRYNQWRNKEELQKYKDLKKEDDDSESSSESEEELPEFDEEFFRALSLLKGKDPRIYDKNYELFSNKEVKKKKAVKEKPMFMKDYERSLVLEKGGEFSEDDDETSLSKVQTYGHEQDKLKESFKKALNDSDDENDDLLQVRTKTKKEEDEEQEDYLKWLKGEENEVSEDVKKDMSYLRDYWSDPKLDDGEKFLRDYILNKRYLEKDDSEIPTYEELTSGMLSDDEKMLEEQEKFEHKYNFRFEEPDEEFIKRYPRTVGDSLRKNDNRRKQKREEKAERIKRDREMRRDELKRLKALKRKEIEEKFLKIKEIAGQDDINLNESDMESDFDPDKHDLKMRELFNEEYYQVEEDQKPEFPFDEELDAENWNNWVGDKMVCDEAGENDNQHHSEDNEENGDSAQENPKDEFEKEMIEATQNKKKTRKKSLFAKVISQPKPIFDPDGKSFEEYLDEYYKLDYEDVIGDLPVRYKYRKVIPNDFGLTVDEILAADDRELNRWCSVKKTCQYRNDEEELYDLQAYKKKSQNQMTKKKILSSVYAPKKPDTETSDTNEILNDSGEPSNNFREASKQTKESIACLDTKSEKDENSFLDASDLNEDDSGQHSKLKKKKRKNLNTDDLSVCEDLSLLDSAKVADSSKLELAKRKRKLKTNSFIERPLVDKEPVSKKKNMEINALHKNDENHGSPPASYESDMTHVLPSSDVPLVPDNQSHAIATKKKKKKKKKKNTGEKTVTCETAHPNQAKSHKLKNNYQKERILPDDKRLALSDERLAAYGINPKKFKSKIVHAKR